MNIFITGDCGVGKTTLINKIINTARSRYYIQGFKTGSPVNEKNKKSDENVYIYSANKEPIFTEKHCIGKRQNIGSEIKIIPLTETFESIGVNILCEVMHNKESIVIMDEIGFLEKKAKKFQSKIMDCLDSDSIVLGVLKNKPIEFIDEILRRSDVCCYHINIENRNLLFTKIYKIIMGRD